MRYIKLTNKPFKWGIRSRVNSPERLFWIKRANETSAPTYLHDRAPPRSTSPVLTLGYVCSLSSVRGRTQKCTNCLALSQSTPHCQRLLVVSLVKISQPYHAFLLRPLKHWEGAATTSSSMKGAAFPAKHLGPQPLKNIQFWLNRSKNKLANWRRELNRELNPSTCIHHRKDPGTQWPGFKPWCRSHTTRQEPIKN